MDPGTALAGHSPALRVLVYTWLADCAEFGHLPGVRQRVAAVSGPFLRQIIVNAFLKWCVTA